MDKKKLRRIIIIAVLVVLVLSYMGFFGNDEDDYGDYDDYAYNDPDYGNNTDYGTSSGSDYSDNTAGNGLSTGSALVDALLGIGGDTGSGSSTEYVESDSSTVNIEDVQAGEGTATVLIYMIGSNLESQGGCATADIREMIASRIGYSDKVNVIIQTGGAKKWKNSWVSAGSVQRFRLVKEELVKVDDIGRASMVSANTLSDFIKWGAKNYPADTMGFIFWDHGGGTLAGFGSDELYNGNLALSDIDTAFTKANVHFNFVGFDACLMGTIETAYMLSQHADYLIASEETEPGAGWYYSNWLQVLDKNPQVDMATLGATIVNDFIADNNKGYYTQSTTLSIIDLSQIPAVYKALCTYMASADTLLDTEDFKTVSTARYKTKSYGNGDYEQVDILDFVKKSNLKGASEVVNAVKNAIIYHNTNMANTNGLAMYFPYNYPKYYQSMASMINGFGMKNTYYDGFFKDFLNVIAHNKKLTTTPIAKLTGAETATFEDYSDASWYSDTYAGSGSAGSAMAVYADTELETVEKGDGFVLRLTDRQWEEITYMDIWLYLDDGEGYIDFGNDNVCEFDDDGDLKVEFDNTWVSIDGMAVPFYAQKEGYMADGSWYTFGFTYAQLTSAETGETMDVDLILYWDDNHDGGYVKGYRKHSDAELTQSERNIMQLKKGDILQFTCDYYTYDGEYEDSYLYGDPIVVGNSVKVSYEDIGEQDTELSVHLVDIYNNEYWTETIVFSW